ncbi:MAG: calcium/sodium antiporter, partial [Gammaproteobacteria bacterium]
MIPSILAIFGGLILLVYGADRFVMGAAGTARALGVSPLIIGLTVVGFGTSAPEILVSGTAAWKGNPGLGFGNAIGSNITNIALVLGITALVMPLTVHSQTLKREFPALLVISIGSWLLVIDGHISRLDSAILLGSIVVLLGLLAFIAIKKKLNDPIIAEFSDEIPQDMPISRGFFWLLVGLVLLLVSSHILVWGAVNIARLVGVSDLVIGLTIVAIGTSLPELAASAMSALKKEHDLVIGNIIGSNMFNLL